MKRLDKKLDDFRGEEIQILHDQTITVMTVRLIFKIEVRGLLRWKIGESFRYRAVLDGSSEV